MNPPSTFDPRKALVPASVTFLGMLALIGLCTGYPCVSTGLRHGIWLDQCPASDLRASAELSAQDLVRGHWGRAKLTVTARWMDSLDADGREQSARIGHSDVRIDLLDSEGELVPGLELREPDWSGDALRVQLKLPTVPDGDYRLRATVDTGFETVEVLAPLALYTPALVHLVSDRPLYKPGQEVLLRAAVLARTDATPVEDRPGVWSIRAPDGTEMLREKARTDAWGVVPTTFPLATDAEEGTWYATWSTGADERSLSFDVRPFELPRYTVDVEPSASWYTVDDQLRLEGSATYTNGAPVADARVEVRLIPQEGRWPLPLAWEEVRKGTTDGSGRFRFDFGEVPADLLERNVYTASVSVVDEAGERRTGSASLVFSEDDLQVESVTAFAGGLIADFNNRAYLRVTRPDGSPLAETDLAVRNPYRPEAAPMTARTDVDGVASLQLDPGDPVTIVHPAPPQRIRPFEPEEVRLQRGQRQPGSESLSMVERRALDQLHPALALCGDLTRSASNTPVTVQVDAAGRMAEAVGQPTPLGRCVEAAMTGLRLPPGPVRTYELNWVIPDSLRPAFTVQNTSSAASGPAVREALDRALLRARRCFARGEGISGSVPLEAHWSTRAGSERVGIALSRPGGHGLAAGTLACAERTLTDVRLEQPAEQDGLGVAELRLDVPQPPGSARPQALTVTGFQLQVDAREGEERIGRTTVDFHPGVLPPLRMRVGPALAKPGETLAVELLRGPDHRGSLPRHVRLLDGSKELAKVPVDRKTRRADVPLPADVEGFLRLEAGPASSVVFVQPTDALSVQLASDDDAYAPGEQAQLTVTTRAGEQPVSASVTLVGVDRALGELAPLTAPDDWGEVMVRAEGEEAFGRFGPRALQLGRVRGENAARAAVMLVSSLPTDVAGDRPATAYASAHPPVEEALITAFYRGLEALVARVRAWERTAPPEARLEPATVAGLWEEVLAEARSTEAPLVDGYGRPLTLGLLPADLLAQLEPGRVVADATRLPEDVVNWNVWVEENR